MNNNGYDILKTGSKQTGLWFKPSIPINDERYCKVTCSEQKFCQLGPFHTLQVQESYAAPCNVCFVFEQQLSIGYRKLEKYGYFLTS